LGCDTLAGSVGNDVVQGDGDDRFIFTSKVAGDLDRVTDFTEGDLLVFSSATFAELGAAGPLSAEAFAQCVSYDASSGTLHFERFRCQAAGGSHHQPRGDFWVA
jgi:hypothetical protein